jgi:transaldolase
MAQNSNLAALCAAGVSVWLDDLSRERLQTGNLQELIDTRSVVGVTTNPTIFHKAITGSDVYDEQLANLAALDIPVAEAIRLLTTHDVRAVCDLLRPVYDVTDGLDGRVSIEVDPGLADDTRRTSAEAELLWWMVDRPNLMVKIPATVAGLPAITAALAAGISVNVTLIFSVERYEAVMDAYLDGLEQADARGRDLARIASVASFFVSRVDSEVDARLDKIGGDEAQALRGKAAIANARLAYERFEQVFASQRWERLEALDARPQRPLWASTGVKDPGYDDTRYVVELVAPGTVNTMPEATLRAVGDHGVVRGDTVRSGYGQARRVMQDLAAVGVDMADVFRALEVDGVSRFQASWRELRDDVADALANNRS